MFLLLDDRDRLRDDLLLLLGLLWLDNLLLSLLDRAFPPKLLLPLDLFLLLDVSLPLDLILCLDLLLDCDLLAGLAGGEILLDLEIVVIVTVGLSSSAIDEDLWSLLTESSFLPLELLLLLHMDILLYLKRKET